jgi:hypothetical protein
MCGNDDEISWKSKHPSSNETLISTMDLEVHGNSCDGNFYSNFLCTTQLINTW